MNDSLLTSANNVHHRSHSQAQCELFTWIPREDATLKEDTAFENQSSPSVEGWLDDRASTGWTGHDTENCIGILPASWWMLTGHGPVIGE